MSMGKALVAGFCAVLLSASLTPACAVAKTGSVASTEKELAKARSELRKTLGEKEQLQQVITTAERQLREIERRIARASRSAAESQTALAAQLKSLQQADRQRKKKESDLQMHRAALSQLLRNSDIQRNQTPLRLMLSQETAGEAFRLLAYNRYFQLQRIDIVQRIELEYGEIQALEKDIILKQQALQIQQEAARREQDSLLRERQKHAALVNELSKHHDEKQRRVEVVERDVNSLEGLLANLRSQAARSRAQQRQNHRVQPPGPRQVESKSKQHGLAPQNRMRVGGGSWPVSGQLLTRYGARLPDGRLSSGLLIAAAEGTSVVSIADGDIVFADWMTGYGNILIIDHGAGYMSLYAHNETLLRRVGQKIRRGESIARVGRSGGQGQSALYFELRRNGQPIDPAAWVRR